MSLFDNYSQYILQHGDEDGIVKKRCKKWKEYRKKGITVDSVPYGSHGGWLHKVLTSDNKVRWRDHDKMVFIDGKRALIISEPYTLSEDTISELIKIGDELDFTVSVNNRFASHIVDTGHCIEIAPLRWEKNQKELEARFESE